MFIFMDCLCITHIFSWIVCVLHTTQHYAIKFVSFLRQVGGFVRVLQCPPQIKLTATT